MRSSVIAFTFALFISTITIIYSSRIVAFSKAIGKSTIKIDRTLTNKEYISQINDVLTLDENFDIENLISKLIEIGTENTTISVDELSSKINPNFVDFTIFKQTTLKNKLADGITWHQLQEFRDEHGFISDLTSYTEFLKDPEDNIFTLYNIPNLNNASDISLENYYHLFTDDKTKAEQFKDYLVNLRQNQTILDEQGVNKLFYSFDNSFKERVTIIPTWNVNYISEALLTTMLSKKYGGKKIAYSSNKIGTILSLRKSEYITNNRLKRILDLEEKQDAVLSYIGDISTFYSIKITQNSDKIETSIILGLHLDRYRIVSITQELI